MSLFPLLMRSLRPSSLMEQHLRLMNQMEAIMAMPFPKHPSFEIEWNDPWYEKKIQNKEQFSVRLDVKNFAPKEITVKAIDNSVIVEGKHEENSAEKGQIMRHFVKCFSLPEGCEAEDVVSLLSKDGVLTVTAPNRAKLTESVEREIPITSEENDKKN